MYGGNIIFQKITNKNLTNVMITIHKSPVLRSLFPDDAKFISIIREPFRHTESAVMTYR